MPITENDVLPGVQARLHRQADRGGRRRHRTSCRHTIARGARTNATAAVSLASWSKCARTDRPAVFRSCLPQTKRAASGYADRRILRQCAKQTAHTACPSEAKHAPLNAPLSTAVERGWGRGNPVLRLPPAPARVSCAHDRNLVRHRALRDVRALGALQPAGHRAVVAARRRQLRAAAVRRAGRAVPRVGRDVRSAGVGRAARSRGRRSSSACSTPSSPRSITTATRCTTRSTSDFSIEHSPFGRDIVREFVDAVRAEGMHAGIYFSLIDWHHPDYPAFTRCRQAVSVREVAPAIRRAVGALPHVHVRAGPRAAHRLRQDRRHLVRRRLGAHRRAVAGGRARRR